MSPRRPESEDAPSPPYAPSPSYALSSPTLGNIDIVHTVHDTNIIVDRTAFRLHPHQRDMVGISLTRRDNPPFIYALAYILEHFQQKFRDGVEIAFPHYGWFEVENDARTGTTPVPKGYNWDLSRTYFLKGGDLLPTEETTFFVMDKETLESCLEETVIDEEWRGITPTITQLLDMENERCRLVKESSTQTNKRPPARAIASCSKRARS